LSIVWNEENAAHLFRRAGFGGTTDEIRQALADGLEGSVDKLLHYQSQPNDLLELRLARLNLYLKSDGKLSDLARWWLVRMIFTARPLEERMTLFWLNHFATAYEKVLHIGWLKSENNTIRENCLGTFRSLLFAVAQDPAMMYWLDTWQNTKTNPNENFGREILELFTLGVGHYSEADVRAAARSFTGWSINGNDSIFQFNSDDHDFSEKTFLGQVGTWNGTDIIRMVCSESAHAQFMAAKLFSYFAYSDPEPAVVDRLARLYLDFDTNLTVLVRAILTSEEMYSAKSLWRKIKSPIEHVVIPSRQLLLADDVDNAFQYLVQEGQTPFDPPDVSGWDDGLSWISPATLLNRMNFADALSRQFDPRGFTKGEGIGSPAELVDFYLRRLGPVPLPGESKAKLMKYVSPNGDIPTGEKLVIKQRGLVRLILSLPEWQML